MKKNRVNRYLGAAVAGLVAGSSLLAAPVAAQDKKAEPKKAGDRADKGDSHVCKGMNSCKGKGGCKSGDNGCAGKNSCEGKGGCAVPVQHGAKPAEKKSEKAGKAACSGKNGCSSR